MNDSDDGASIDEFLEQSQRQTAAPEDLAEQVQIQNAVLLEVVSALQRRNRLAMKRDPDDWPSPKSRATSVEDNVLHLAESVDVDAAERYADP